MHLSDTETRILLGIARGASSKAIAHDIGRSKATIESYVRILFAKLNARSRPHLVARAIALKLIDVSDRVA